MSNDSLAKYKPPVVETILSAQFEPIPGFNNGHLGAFWTHIGGKARWPSAVDAAPAAPEFERFGDERMWARMDTMMLGIAAIPTSRLQLRNEAGDRMLQLQNGRFTYNWIGNPSNEYATYKKIKPEFLEYFAKLHEFLRDESLPAPQLNQWEIAYINQIPKGTVWSQADDWDRIFSFRMDPPPVSDECVIETRGGNWVYEITPRRGRLRVQIQHGWTGPGGREAIFFSLTARGPTEGSSGRKAVEAGLDLGHDVIVASFKKLALQEVHGN